MADKPKKEDSKAIVTRTDDKMHFRLMEVTDAAVPEELAALMEAENLEAQRHVKMRIGDMVRGIYQGSAEGELSARGNGEVPVVKWHYIQTAPGVTIRMLGAYNLNQQLERAEIGDKVVIGRGEDYDLPNGFRCSDYFVLLPRKDKPNPNLKAGRVTVDVTPPKT